MSLLSLSRKEPAETESSEKNKNRHGDGYWPIVSNGSGSRGVGSDASSIEPRTSWLRT
jgi:hypothetical protein